MVTPFKDTKQETNTPQPPEVIFKFSGTKILKILLTLIGKEKSKADI